MSHDHPFEIPHLTWARTVPGGAPINLAESAVRMTPLPSRLPPIDRQAGPALARAIGLRAGAPCERVLLTAGASEANAVVFAALLRHGDEALVEMPGYQPHRRVPGLFGATVRPLARRQQDGFRVTAGCLEPLLSERTRLVVLSDLHNPTGVALIEGDVADLAALAESHGFHLLIDEAYRDTDASRPLGTWAATHPRIVATSTLTKSYGLGTLRLGWIAANQTLLDRFRLVLDGLSVHPSLPSIMLASAILPELDDLLGAATTRLVTSREILAASSLPTPVAKPRGTTAFFRLGDAEEGDRLAEKLLEDQGLAIVPGGYFGDPGGFRIGLDTPDLEKGLRLVGKAIAASGWLPPTPPPRCSS